MWHHERNGSAVPGVLAQLVDQDRHRDPECGDRLSRAPGDPLEQVDDRRELVGEQLRALDLRAAPRQRVAAVELEQADVAAAEHERDHEHGAEAVALDQLDLGRVGGGVADDDLAGRARPQHPGGRRVVVEAVPRARLRPAVAADVLHAVLAGHDARDRGVLGPQHRRDHRRALREVVGVAARG